MLIASLAVGLLYLPGLSGAFFFDDLPSIIHVHELQQDGGWLVLLMEAWQGGGAGPLGRPVAQFSFALNHLFSGLDPYAFKATNLAIHIVTGWVVCLFVVTLFSAQLKAVDSRHAVLMALMVTFVWMLHPLQFLVILHVVQRMTSLSALFLLLAIFFHILARDRNGCKQWMFLGFAWGVLWPLSVLSKETGLLFPLYVLAWELLLRRATIGHLDRLAKSIMWMVSAFIAGSLVYLLMPSGAWLLAGYEMRGFTLAERVLTQGRGIWFYISLLLYPRLEAFGLYHDDFVVSSSLLLPLTTLLSYIGVFLALLVIAIFRNRQPLLAFGLAWFFIGHLLESTIFPLELIHEHRNYLPMLGLLIALSSVLRPIVVGGGYKKTLCLSVVVSFVFFAALTTHMRSLQYENDLVRAQLEVQYHPNSSRAHYEAASLLAELPATRIAGSPAYSFALFHFDKAGKLDKNQKLSWLGNIALNCDARQPVNDELLKQLSWRLENTPFAPGDRNVLYFLKELAVAGRLCLAREQVENLFSSAYRNKSVSVSVVAMLHSWHADYLWLTQSDMSSAVSYLQNSLKLNPSSESTRLKLLQLYFIENQFDAFDSELASLKPERLSRDERRLLDEMLNSGRLIQ
jgi:protein O-mannosyl-transferase